MSGLPEKSLTLMLVCGEPSGDQLGAQLMAALKALGGDSVKIVGVGGEAMAAQGLKSLFPLDATAVMGLTEVVPRIPAILARVRQAADFAVEAHADAVVLIDSPDFTHRIARRLKAHRAENCHHQLCCAAGLGQPFLARPRHGALFRHGAGAAAVRGAVLRGIRAALRFRRPSGDRARQAHDGRRGVSRPSRHRAQAPLLAVLPGSRTGEIHYILPAFRAAVGLLAQRLPGLVIVLPTVPHVAVRVRAATADWPAPLHIVEGEDEKFAAFDAADAALAASGTVTTELALSRTPMVVGYKVGWLTHALMKPLIHVEIRHARQSTSGSRGSAGISSGTLRAERARRCRRGVVDGQSKPPRARLPTRTRRCAG